ncbi:hypothetical protein JG687_00013709 [Phytophthora cactorum]|uniref:RXLR phytopathogen effector protein WY-domain domain-containing protein n=1 Tax=Phytophthora cactorum TaxID=29920 RepID=A0A8T1TZL5_9STRA|nr:hypothetical protein JG687_00013709 [Phytophthora cactorum]
MSKLDDLAYKLALKNDMNPTDLFLHLRVVKTDGELQGNPKFIRWLQYAMKYRAKRGGEFRFSDEEIFDLLTKTKPEAELVVLFQSLRQVPGMKTLAENMQAYMVLSSASSHRLVNEAWLKSRETPQQVFKILRLQHKALDSNPLFIQWLRYIKLYRSLAGSESFSDAQTLNFLLNEKWFLFESTLGTLFQSLKAIPDLETYGNLEAYTMQFAEHKGGRELLEKVKKMFADNDPNAALAAASKA